ncbi:hypothetical protein BASA81_011059 [Batrachochytrium salamandrivorans]|nr:hypothetical protein BASA81_011059 [Batrachochytrium salamandrivorans]
MEEELPNSLKALEEKLATWENELNRATKKVNHWNEKVENAPLGSEERKEAKEERTIAIGSRDKAQQMVLALMEEKDRQAEHLDVGTMVNVLKFGAGSWWGDQPIVERECYKTVFNYICNVMESRKSHLLLEPGVLITGTPGIGKSLAAVYIAARLFQEKGSLICYQYKEKRPFLLVGNQSVSLLSNWGIHAPGVYEVCDSNTLESLMGMKDLVRIWDPADQVTATTSPCFTIFSSSPNKTKVGSLKKEHVRHYYMELWTLDELQLVGAVMRKEGKTWLLERLASGESKHVELTDELIAKRFGIFGGSARCVFDLDQDTYLQQALTQMTSFAAIRAFFISGADIKTPDLSHYLIHRSPLQLDHAQYNILISSPYVREELLMQFDEQSIESMNTFLASGRGHGELGSFRGLRFEPDAHRAIIHGGTFSIAPLGSRNNPIKNTAFRAIKFPKSTTRRFRSELSELKTLSMDDYAKPWIGNFESLDSVCILPEKLFFPEVNSNNPCIVGFQMTVSPDHKLLGDGLKRAFDHVIAILEGKGPMGAKMVVVFVTNNKELKSCQRIVKSKPKKSKDEKEGKSSAAASDKDEEYTKDHMSMSLHQFVIHVELPRVNSEILSYKKVE